MSKYKIKITNKAPNLHVKEIYAFKKCYLGVSINNPFFGGNHFNLLLEWIDKRFENCTIVIGDHIHRLNIEMFKGYSEDKAIDEALKEGSKIYENIKKELEKYDSNKFTLKRWSDFYDDKSCQIKKKDLRENYINTIKFQNQINLSAKEFINRQIERNNSIKTSFERANELSVEYILEEMAVFSILIDTGCKIQVYPGTQLSILKSLANGDMPEVNTNIKEGIYIDLTWKKIKK